MTDDKPRRAADTDGALPTDLAPPRGKLFTGPRAVTARIDGSSEDAVFDLAFELQHADRRRLLAVTAAELQILSRFAVRWATVASQADHLTALVDSDAPIPAIVAARETVYGVVRLMMRDPSPEGAAHGQG